MRRLLLSIAVFGSAAQAIGQPTAPRATITEDLRLDANAEDFSTILRVHVGPRREIIVPLPRDVQIRMYDSTGKRIAAFGRRGDGPGEFEALGYPGWTNDTLWFSDVRRRRFTFIAPDGRFLRTVPFPGPVSSVLTIGSADTISATPPFAMYADGSYSSQGHRLLSIAESVGRGSPSRLGQEVVVRTSASGATRVLATAEDVRDGWVTDADGFGMPKPFAFAPAISYAFDGSRFALLSTALTSNDAGTIRLSMFRENGDTAFARMYPFRGIPLSQGAVDSAITASLAPMVGNIPDDALQRLQRLARASMPTVAVPVLRFTLGLDNTVWITFRGSGTTQEALVLDGRGNPIGSVLLPPRSRIQQASATHIWMTETDADGLASVVRYRVTGIVCGANCRE